MKNITLLIILLAIMASCKKKNSPGNPSSVTYPDPVYAVYTGSMGTLSTIFTNDNNVAILATSNKGNILLYKVSQAGSLIWSKEIILPDTNYFGKPRLESIAQTDDNGYLLSGTVYVPGHYNGGIIVSSDVYLLKISSAGNVEWSKTFGGDKDDYGNRIIKTKDGKFLICGTSYSFTTEGYQDIYLVKIDGNGDSVWTASYPLHEQQTPFHILETNNGELLVTGTDEPTGFERIVYLLKISSTGIKLWDRSIGSTTDPSHYFTWAYCSAECNNGDLMITGAYKGALFLLRTDGSGNKLWERTYADDADTTLQNAGFAIKKNSDNTFTITGSSYDYRDQSARCILQKIDDKGNKLYSHKLTGINSYVGLNLLKCLNGDNIITGNNYKDSTLADIFFTRTDNDGNYK